MTSGGVLTLTVVVPVWDEYVEMLGDALEALRSVGESSVGVLVVDNASTRVVPRMAGTTILPVGRRMSPGAIRNHALAHVRTPLVMFWDADDVALPGAIVRLLSALEAQPNAVAVAAASLGWDPRTDARQPWIWPRSWAYRWSTSPRVLSLLSLLSNPFPTTGPVVMRTSTVRDAGGFSEDTEYGEDWGLAAALARRGRIVMLPDRLRLYRVHGGSLTSEAARSARTYAECLRSLRVRARRDARTPAWLRLLLPLVRAVHGLNVVRWSRGTSGGSYYLRFGRPPAS